MQCIQQLLAFYFNSTTVSSGSEICNSLVLASFGNAISDDVKHKTFPGEHAPGAPKQRASPRARLPGEPVILYIFFYIFFFLSRKQKL